jgi:hypothetical protein
MPEHTIISICCAALGSVAKSFPSMWQAERAEGPRFIRRSRRSCVETRFRNAKGEGILAVGFTSETINENVTQFIPHVESSLCGCGLFGPLDHSFLDVECRQYPRNALGHRNRKCPVLELSGRRKCNSLAPTGKSGNRPRQRKTRWTPEEIQAHRPALERSHSAAPDEMTPENHPALACHQ